MITDKRHEPPSPAVQFEMLLDLYAPRDEDGERQPGAGFLSRKQFMHLATMDVDK
jgi:hypothetical protein